MYRFLPLGSSIDFYDFSGASGRAAVSMFLSILYFWVDRMLVICGLYYMGVVLVR